MAVEIRAYLGAGFLDKEKIIDEINTALRGFHPSNSDLVQKNIRLLTDGERALVSAQIIYEIELLEHYRLRFQSWMGPFEECAKIWYNFNSELIHTKSVIHMVLDIDQEVAMKPEFIGAFDYVIKSHSMLDEGEKIRIKNKIAENTAIIIVERTSDKFNREQQHVLYTTPQHKDKKCHVFLKPWADATWERTDRHLSPDEVGVKEFYSINVIEDDETGAERVVHTVVQPDRIKPNKP